MKLLLVLLFMIFPFTQNVKIAQIDVYITNEGQKWTHVTIDDRFYLDEHMVWDELFNTVIMMHDREWLHERVDFLKDLQDSLTNPIVPVDSI